MSLSGLGGDLSNIPVLRDAKRKRFSSYDRTGGNKDYLIIPAGETATLAEMKGAGTVKHIWVTIRSCDEYYLRKLVLRAYWDGEKNPSVEVPIGDFFGIGHAITKNYVSAPLQMSPEDGKGFNCWFPMPYSNGARITIENQGNWDCESFYYYVDYEEYKNSQEGLGRFHATWHRDNPTEGDDSDEWDNPTWLFRGTNLDGKENYVILEAEGKGHYVGCNMNVHNLRSTLRFNWYGEGDDMIFIDGEKLPSLIGTGTEDFYGMSWCPTQEYCAPYHGLPLPGSDKNWNGKITWYRYHILDPIYFEKSIKVTIEHGHANKRSDDYSSTAYWYQTEPHKKFKPLPPVQERLPREKP
jgi:hypothetical protein